MDSFYVSVERVLDPSLEGKPVMVGGGSGRGVVTSASYEARQFGVRSAMPGFQARRLCPDGIFVPGRRKIYSEFSAKVFDLLRTFSPDVRAFSIDEGLVNLTGTERLMGHPIRVAHEIIGRIRNELGLPSSGGLAAHPTVAKIAATTVKPRGPALRAAGLGRTLPGAPRRIDHPRRRPQDAPGARGPRHRHRGATPRPPPARGALPEPGPPGVERARPRALHRERDHARPAARGYGGPWSRCWEVSWERWRPGCDAKGAAPAASP